MTPRRALGAGLIAATALFLGSAVPARAQAPPPPPPPNAGAGAGAAGFQANCAVCHGPAGAGIPALAPPLVSNPARYAANAEGRRQLAMTVLYGLYGEIVVDDKHYDFRMPDFARLDDATLAAILNFVVFDLSHAAPGVKALEPAEIAAERGKALDGAAVHEHRKTVAP